MLDIRLIKQDKAKIMTSVRMLEIRFSKQDKTKILTRVRMLDIKLRCTGQRQKY